MSDPALPTEQSAAAQILARQHPYDALPPDEIGALTGAVRLMRLAPGERVYDVGDALAGLYVVLSGHVEVREPGGALVSMLGAGNSFGERGLLRDGVAVTAARANAPTEIALVPADLFRRLLNDHAPFARFFERRRPPTQRPPDLATMRLGDIMTQNPATIGPDSPIRDAARILRDNKVSCLPVVDGARLVGILTAGDLARRAVAEDLPGDAPVRVAMTPNPITLPPTALGADVLLEMLESGVGHLPVVDGTSVVGIVTRTDLTRLQAVSAVNLIGQIVRADAVGDIADEVRRIPALLAQLVGAGAPHQVVTRLITDIGDAATRRLLRMAEAEFGPPPAPYAWLACGSQGRQEQTGVSDQDNALVLDDSATEADDAYFAQLAKFVSDGLDACGYFYCPGDMMATNPRWRQPLRVWRSYFDGWIAKPDPMAQMLASVMFDLRLIGGEDRLFNDLTDQTLDKASTNSIFVAHMIANSVKNAPPLGLFGGMATIRSGEHKNTIDLKHNGVAPVVDLGRIYALKGALTPVNTRARVEAAQSAGVVSESGGEDLLDAYDLIADMRLNHQAAQVRAGQKPDNFMPPASLSALERSHLRDAFVVVSTMQSALAQGKGGLS